MSRLVGIVALVIAFGWSGFILYRLASPRLPMSVQTPIRVRAVADLEAVQRDLCSLAQAEMAYQRLTGHYTAFYELQSDGRTTPLPDSRWPYRYVLHVPAPETFVITAVAEAPVENQPQVLLIDNQLQVQTRTHPPQVYPCSSSPVTKNK